jgi:hypothetical protein
MRKLKNRKSEILNVGWGKYSGLLIMTIDWNF